MIKKIFNFIPIWIFYTNRWVSKDAKSFGLFINIKPERKDDIGLLKHELKHSEQAYKTLFIHFLLYKFSKKYRYKSELEAYREQIIEYKYSSISQTFWIVDILYKGYDLKIERFKIVADIKKIIDEVNNAKK